MKKDIIGLDADQIAKVLVLLNKELTEYYLRPDGKRVVDRSAIADAMDHIDAAYRLLGGNVEEDYE